MNSNIGSAVCQLYKQDYGSETLIVVLDAVHRRKSLLFLYWSMLEKKRVSESAIYLSDYKNPFVYNGCAIKRIFWCSADDRDCKGQIWTASGSRSD